MGVTQVALDKSFVPNLKYFTFHLYQVKVDCQWSSVTMVLLNVVVLLLVIFGLCEAKVVDPPTATFSLQMPYSKPANAEAYLCTPMQLDKTSTHYIVGFEPVAAQKTAHHMLLYGCKGPGRQETIFNCGAMAIKDPKYNSALQPCGSGAQVVYAWAKNAPDLDLPDGVGFRVGGPDSEIDWLVLQVHYASIEYIPEEGDQSGVILHYTNVPQPKAAGVYYSGTSGRFPARTTTHSEAACELTTDQEIHPFAFRVHTHGLGTVVSGWKVTPNMEWTLLGKKDPQLPQMFYPVDDNTITMKKGDKMATRCTMENFKSSAVSVGATNEDEMCNFYLMYYVDGSQIMDQKTCFSMGPPIYSWGGWLLGGGLSNIPDEEASTL